MKGRVCGPPIPPWKEISSSNAHPVSSGCVRRCAGYVTFLRTFDADGDLVSSEVVLERGPHPDLDSDFEAFCDVMVPALGL